MCVDIPVMYALYIYILMVFIIKNTVINVISGDLTRKLDMASSFTATGMSRRNEAFT